MPNYIRSKTIGATYFFTLVSYQRQSIFIEEYFRNALREAIKKAQQTRPFKIDAWVLMPDHLHCIWTLPNNDFNFSTRWSRIKRDVSMQVNKHLCPTQAITSKAKHREAYFWQRRFWEHQIRDERDFEKHVDYIHFNPVKHGLSTKVVDWPYSTFHRYCAQGIYPSDWGGEQVSEDGRFGE